jgi:hypothetical protein
MSKIRIPLKNIRGYLHDLFHEYLESRYELECTHRYVDDDDDDTLDEYELLWLMQQGYVFDDVANYYDDGDVIWPPKKMGKNRIKSRNDDDAYADYWEKKMKKKHKKGGGRSRIIDINTPYSGEEESPTEYATYEEIDGDGLYDGKQIWFYPDYMNKDDRLEFSNLKDFDDYCSDNGYIVPPYYAEEIAYRRISHVCLKPQARERGVLEIMAAESYADMMYDACDVMELSQ